MRRVPNRRGYIVMAVGLLNIVVLFMYLCVIKDELFERLLFWSFRPNIFSVRIFEDLCRD